MPATPTRDTRRRTPDGDTATRPPSKTNDRSGPKTPRPGLVNDAEIEAASDNWQSAFALLGLVTATGLICPKCGTSGKKKVLYKTEKHYWKCYKCGEFGSLIKLVQERLDLKFPAAVRAINGDGVVPTEATEKARELASELAEMALGSNFTAVLDVEVYEAVMSSKYASLFAAQRYYAEWHIAGSAVAEQRSVAISDCEALHADLRKQFGEERLIASGLATEPTERKGRKVPPRLLVNENYPVIEPAIGPSGKVLNMQFRPAGKQKDKVRAHKRGKAEKDAAEAAGEEWTRSVPAYAPAFLSLRGQTAGHLVGLGLERIAKLPPGRTIYVVEGFKDLLAARTMGAEAYAMPGTGILPPEKVCKLFADNDHTMLVALDGDEAGTAARAKVLEHFATYGVKTREKTDMPAGMDVTDILVSREADKGCPCPTCKAWRASHPAT